MSKTLNINYSRKSRESCYKLW